MYIHLKIIGILLMILALVHFIFPKYFDWKKELASLSLINRELMYVHAFFIAFGIFLMGLLCFLSANELLHTPFGKKIALGFAVFWLVRLAFQFFGYSSKTWRGKPFETFVHYAFAAFWTYLTVIFSLVYFN